MKPLKKLNEGYNSGKQNNEPSNINSTNLLSSSISTMNNEQSIVVYQSGDVEQASVHPKDAITHPERNGVQKIQNVLLIWLDNNIDETSTVCRNTISLLRRTVNYINIFTNAEECLQFIDNVTDIKACMIITGALGRHIVPHIHPMSQVNSIFLFCDDKEYHEQWIKEWPKIKGIYTEISSICEALKQAAQQCEQNAISINLVAAGGDDVSKKNLDQLDPIFMYSQILKEILLTIEFDDGHIKQFIDYCRDVFADNDGELKNVAKLQTQYHTKTPVWWYTCESFLYPMLNRALRLMDMDIIIKMGFFITDLHRHIEQLHSEQFSGSNSNQIFTVYRGHGMSKTEFDQMTKIQGGLMSFNNFLSTNKDRQVSLGFARRALPNMDMVGILFVMAIDPLKLTTSFASITDVGYSGDQEDEVLFSMHTVFRIDKITNMDENPRLFQVNLILTSENDKDLSVLTNRIREETYPDEKGWFRLGILLLKMGESAKAQQVYEILLEQTTDMDEKAAIYHQLGSAKDAQGEYNEAITYYEKALEIYRKTLSPIDSSLANCYNNIGEVCRKMGNYPKGLSYYERALEIRKQSLPSNHPDLGGSYNNIGMMYSKKGDYPKALSYYEKALEIRKESLSSNHPDLGGSYNNIGNVYYCMADYSKALSSHEKALQIKHQSLPLNHPDFGGSYNSIGNVYDNMGDYPKGLSYYEKALEIQQQSLPSNHPDLGISYNNIGGVYFNMADYPKALSYYEKGLEIQQQSLPSNHPDLGMSYNNIGMVYHKMGDYPKALSNYEKALEIKHQSLPSNHPDLGGSYNNIGNVYYNTGDYPKALSKYEKALEIQQQSLPSNHPDLGSSYNNIGMIYKSMGDYVKALSYYEKALEIRKESLPLNHPDLGGSYNSIGMVYSKMGDYPKALSCHEKALEIRKKSLSSNHPDLGGSYNNIGNVYYNTGDYPKALSNYEKALEIKHESLPPNHPSLASSYNNIGNGYYCMADYSKALSSHEKALEIEQQSLPSNHPDLGMSYNNIGLLYEKIGNYSKAHSFYERAVKIGQHSLPTNHPDLQEWKRNLNDVKNEL